MDALPEPEPPRQPETYARGIRPGTPSLLRELNDRAALELLLVGEPLTRAQISERTGVSKVTVSQMLTRLEERGLVTVAGEQAGGRGPNAALYSVVPSSAYIAGLYVESDLVSAAVADATGRCVADVSVDPNGSDDPVELVRGAVSRACASAGVELARLTALVIGSPGVLDPRTGDPRLAVNLPAWHEGVLGGLREVLHKPVVIENDVNLAAMAERADGAAAGLNDFAMVWIGVGLGLATVIGGQVRRGTGGAAGEIGWMPVHGAPLPAGDTHPGDAGLQALAGAKAVRALADSHGFTGLTAEDAVNEAVLAGPRGAPFLDELAHRVALGVAAVCVVLDPGLVVLGGSVGRAGGEALATRVSAEVPRICLARPRVVPTAVTGEPVLRGAVLAALAQAHAALLASVADPQLAFVFMTSLPLDGIVVVAVEQAVAAPFCTRQLADLGARVIKVERPGSGDFARGYDQRARGLSSHFFWLNRGKESIELDLSSADGRAVLAALLARADVLVQNLAPGAASRLGLFDLAARHPRLITCSITGYGSSGPYRGKKAYDLLVQCETGVLAVTGTPDSPAKAGISVADIAAGMYAYSGILAALFARFRTGRGTAFEVSLLDALGEWMSQPVYYDMAGGSPLPRAGARHASISPYGPYPAADGTVFLGVQNDTGFAALCTQILQRGDLLLDPRFATNVDRIGHDAELASIISAVTSRMPAGELIEALDAAGIPCALLRTPAEFASHPQLVSRGRWRSVATPAGPIPAMLPPLGFGPDGDAPMGAIPALGEHTAAIRAELGL